MATIARKKPHLLIVGHGRHGKDTFAELIAKVCNLSFESSSTNVQEIVWKIWGCGKYPSFEAMVNDGENPGKRAIWAEVVNAYNTPDKSKTSQDMIDRGSNMYVGMRRKDELEASKAKGMYDLIIWVDACKRLPVEDPNAMDITQTDCDWFVDNNTISEDPYDAMSEYASVIQNWLHMQGFDVGNISPIEETAETEELPELGARLEWTDAPIGATEVLDHGFIYVQEVMGSDESIAGSARMSYGRGTKKINNDAGLINYLVKNHHTSPLEMGEIKFHIRMPIFTARQWIRHRTANLNEYSGRYSEMVRLFYTPETAQICYQDTVNKQGSGDPLKEVDAIIAQSIIHTAANDAFNYYENLLSKNVSRETARIVLPLNTYTEVVWKLDVSNLIKFLYLRDDSHAQWEIRVYAIEIAKAVKKHFPLVYAAYMRERESTSLNQAQIQALIENDSTGLPKGEAKVVNDLLAGFDLDTE